MKNFWIIGIGFANLLDGLARIGSLGFWISPGFGQKASFYYAKKQMKTRG